MARKKRSFTTFNLSFLDIMSCGFGAVVLVFLIIDHSMEVQSKEVNRDLLSEVSLLEEDIESGEKNLVRVRNTLSDLDLQIVEAQGRATRITEEIDSFEALIEALEQEGLTEDAEIDKLKAEVLSLKSELEKLKQAAEEQSGASARTFLGEGSRQYLTGLNLGGDRILILLDVSASMLAERLVNVIRLRNMDAATQRQSHKWTRALNTVDWLTAQLPPDANYQVITFNTEAIKAGDKHGEDWREVADQETLEALTNNLREIVPSDGTSLENAFLAVRDLSPLPDNIFLITDGLPTQGKGKPIRRNISGPDRQKLFRRAVKLLPHNVPVNIILFPMEGDPFAAAEFWELAHNTRGAFLSPAEDWP